MPFSHAPPVEFVKGIYYIAVVEQFFRVTACTYDYRAITGELKQRN